MSKEHFSTPGALLRRGATSRFHSVKARLSTLVHPCVIDDRQTLVYERGLKLTNPDQYKQVSRLAKKLGFQTKEDQRSDFIEGIRRVRAKRHANVVTVALLYAALSSYNTPTHSKTVDPEKSSPEITQEMEIPLFDFNVTSYSSQEEMISAMFAWINNHSSFNHDIKDIPAIKRVSNDKMTQIAFGDELPRSVDHERSTIYGLYNFNEGTVYLLDELDMNSDMAKGVLLHELVHFLQYKYKQDKTVKCKNALESLAYRLEARFLQAYNRAHNITVGRINEASQCS